MEKPAEVSLGKPAEVSEGDDYVKHTHRLH
jgi:hypothetical protein